MLVFLTLAHHVNRSTLLLLQTLSHSPACLLPTILSRLLQLLPPPLFIHPALMLLAVPAIVPLVQSGRAKRSSSSLPTTSPPFDSDWCREPPGSQSSPTALLWLFSNGMRQKMIVHVAEVVSCFKVVSSVSSWRWKDRRRKEKNNTRTRSLISLFFHLVLVCYFLSLLLFLLPFLSHLLALFNNHCCCLVWRRRKNTALISSFSFRFHFFGYFFTRQSGVVNPVRLIDLNLGNFVAKQAWFLLQCVEWKHSDAPILVITSSI